VKDPANPERGTTQTSRRGADGPREALA
jgi:hypothetical protein